MPSLLSPAEARVLISTPLSDSNLQAVIDRLEAEAARVLGPLSGSRTETFWLDRGYHRGGPFLLHRPTDGVTVKAGGADVLAENVRLVERGTSIELVLSTWPWSPAKAKVEVTYTPNDAAEVKGRLIDGLRMVLAESPFQSERIGDYSYQRAGTAADSLQARQELWESLLPSRSFGTVRLRSGIEGERVTVPQGGWPWA